MKKEIEHKKYTIRLSEKIDDPLFEGCKVTIVLYYDGQVCYLSPRAELDHIIL